MDEEAVWFESGDARCFGIRSPGGDRGTVLFLHGFTSDHIGPNRAFVDLAHALAAAGFDAFRFDLAGSGDSTGAFREQGLETSVRDAKNALDAVEADGKIGVVGHSKGGSVALLLAREVEVDAAAVWATIDDYADLWPEVMREQAERSDTVTIYGHEYGAENALEPLEHDFAGIAADLDAPLLVAHGRQDEQVPFHHAEALHDAAGGELLALDRSGHLFDHPDEREELVARTADWFDTHL